MRQPMKTRQVLSSLVFFFVLFLFFIFSICGFFMGFNGVFNDPLNNPLNSV